MSFLLHELMELGFLISAIAVTWAVPRPEWVSRLYTRIARFFGSQKTFNLNITYLAWIRCKYFYVHSGETQDDLHHQQEAYLVPHPLPHTHTRHTIVV